MMSDETPSYYITIILAPSPLGWFGAHKYYVGKKKVAALYALFFWTMIPPVLSVIDTTLLIYRGEEYFLEEYGTKKDMQKYHLREVMRNNPKALNPEIRFELAQSDDLEEVLGDKSVDEVFNEDETIINESNDESQEDENERDKPSEPDYDDYYGEW